MASPRANVEQVLARAWSQRGVSERPAYSNRTPYTEWYGMTGPWCAMFVSWAFYTSGNPLPRIRTSKGFAYCPDIVNWARANGCWHSSRSSYVPKRGDIILFDFGMGRASHVGIVLGLLPGNRVQTIEGNTSGGGGRDGGSVVVHNRARSGSTIGYVSVENVGKVVAPVVVNRKWRGFQAGATDASIARLKGETNQVTEVQLILHRLGDTVKGSMYPGAVDGVYGPKSQKAITEFKKWIIAMQKATKQKPWPNTDTNVGVLTIRMLRYWLHQVSDK